MPKAIRRPELVCLRFVLPYRVCRGLARPIQQPPRLDDLVVAYLGLLVVLIFTNLRVAFVPKVHQDRVRRGET